MLDPFKVLETVRSYEYPACAEVEKDFLFPFSAEQEPRDALLEFLITAVTRDLSPLEFPPE